MSAAATPIFIAVLGVAVLTALTFAPNAQSRQIALLIPPWQADGLSRAASTGVAIVAMHWDRHVIVVDTGGDPAALDRLRSQGLWLLDATGTALCESTETRT
ncbi:hypothetical protein NX862_17260 [Rhodobacter sp. KR11]|jgi:hypothetical protein|uniref:hypothetical protein n=1 Tax=Rhodobacter sp. KR11 TaxID=2974588 RepID=UPI002222D74A|nr:hypothetical protein [Rhodobacter sp. KR11]MCW1920510.1 hypothetical protein [Rhodobacter sp. KR11]